MKILRPSNGVPSSKVESWDQIKDMAAELKDLVANGPFEGYHDEPLGIHHQQVANPSLDFFVLCDEVKEFWHWCVVNLVIHERSEPVEFEEGCMSWPYRKPRSTYRFDKIKVTFSIPDGDTLKEVTQEMEGLPAIIAQHESDHGKGINIYGK